MTNAASSNTNGERKVSLAYLFFTFLKVGAFSFGGNMALVAVVKSIMVDRDKTVKDETILDAIGIATLLPGPLAVNIVAYTGYQLRRGWGTIASMTAVILPAFIAMLILSWAYFKYGYQQQFKEIMYYVTGAVSALIATTGFQLFEKEVKGHKIKILICALSIVAILFTHSYLLTILFIVFGGIVGAKINLNKDQVTSVSGDVQKVSLRPDKTSVALLIILSCIALLFVGNVQQYVANIFLKIILIFSGMSLSLFGGGYVMIPIMQNLFVADMHWLSNQEFLDAIAFSQSTPGPILVSATFIGYKVAGFAGAVLATIAIFAPSATLMILVAKIYSGLKQHPLAKKCMAGVKAVVIGLIIGAAVKIGQQINWNIPLAVITVLAFVASFRYKVSPVYIIISSALLGYCIMYFSK